MRQPIGVVFILAGLNCASAQQYIISTLAGGAPLPTPAVALNTSIPFAGALALDSAGNLYVAGDNCLFQIAPTGVLTRVAGNARLGFSGDGGPATSAQFGNIAGLAVDPAGNIYIADSVNNRIRKVSAVDGTIATVAGNGTAGYSPDGTAATSAELNGPTAVALDKAGNLYIADTGNNRVREVGKDGTIATVAGNGLAKYAGDSLPAIYASLNAPNGLAFDSAGYLYISDSQNFVVRKIGISSVITTVAGTGQKQKGGLDLKPNTLATSVPLGVVGALAIGPPGTLFISDPDNNAIWEVTGGLISTALLEATVGLAVDSAGNIYHDDDSFDYDYESTVSVQSPNGTSTQLTTNYFPGGVYSGDGGPAISARLSSPQGVALDGSGSIYIADYNNAAIRVVDPDGMMSTFDPLGGARGYNDVNVLGETSLFRPTALGFDPSGNLFVIDSNNLYQVTPKGLVSIWAAVFTRTAANPGIGVMDGLAADVFGSLYVSTPEQIRKFTASNKSTLIAGIGTTGFGQDNVGANTTPLNWPIGVAVDPFDNLYIADSRNQRIRKVSGGIITTVAGNGTQGYKGDKGPATSAELNNPMGVALDSAGNLYIADTGNNVIRKVSTSGTITTITGTGTAAYSGDGGPATSAALNAPYNVQVDKAGNVYVADTGNNAIRVLSGLEPLSLSTATLPNGTTGISYSASLAAAGGVLPYTWSVSAGALPGGLTLSNAGIIAGKPSSPGTFNFAVTVTDSASSSAAQPFNIRVIAPLTITAAGTYVAIAGTSYSQALTASGGTPPYIWSVVSGTLPAGLVLSSSGVLNGVPATLGTAGFGVQVTDSANLIAAQGFLIEVVNPAPVIATAAVLSTGVTGMPYSQTLSATCGNPPCSWSVAAGALPAGLQLSTGGAISGVPTASGAFNFTLAIADNAALTVNQSFELTVIDGTSVARTAVLPQVLMGNGWATTIMLSNSSSNPIAVLIQAHGDDGSVTSSASLIAPNATFTFPIGDPTTPATLSGWVDVLTSGTLAGSATFQLNGNPQGAAVPLQTQFEPEVDVTFDNTGPVATGVALVNLSAGSATITATIFDGNGVQLDVEQIALAASGHTSFTLAAQLTATAGQQGIVKFQNAAGANIAGLILQTAADGTLSAIPVALP